MAHLIKFCTLLIIIKVNGDFHKQSNNRVKIISPLCLTCVTAIAHFCGYFCNSLPPSPSLGHAESLPECSQKFLVTEHQQSSVISWALWVKFSLHSIHTGPTLTCTGDEFVPSKGVDFGHSLG